MKINSIFLQLIILFVLVSCGASQSEVLSSQESSTKNETSVPGVLKKENISFEEGIKKINHVVVIYMENHSFDNLFGEFEGANGIANATREQITQVDENDQPYDSLPEIPRNSAFPTNLPNDVFSIEEYVPADKATPDVRHRFYHNIEQINNGKMNKFALNNDTKGLTMGHYKTENLPLYDYAKKYTLADNFFQSVFGGSYFNHVYLISAAVPIWHNAPEDMIAEIDNKGRMVKDGVVSPDGYVVNHVYPRNPPFPPQADTTKLLPPQGMPTIGERLSEKDISWAWYSEGWDKAVAGEETNYAYNHEPFVYFEKYGPGTEARKKHLKDQNDYLEAAKNGMLPAVSFVKPGHGYDEHPGSAAIYPSEERAVELIDAVMKGPHADDSLVILTYDEYGGWWDHVNPPIIDRWGPGSRIPAIIISPFAKKGYVDSAQYETVSILAFIEQRWGLKPLSKRDANANPFRGALEFNSTSPREE